MSLDFGSTISSFGYAVPNQLLRNLKGHLFWVKSRRKDCNRYRLLYQLFCHWAQWSADLVVLPMSTAVRVVMQKLWQITPKTFEIWCKAMSSFVNILLVRCSFSLATSPNKDWKLTILKRAFSDTPCRIAGNTPQQAFHQVEVVH